MTLPEVITIENVSSVFNCNAPRKHHDFDSGMCRWCGLHKTSVVALRKAVWAIKNSARLKRKEHADYMAHHEQRLESHRKYREKNATRIRASEKQYYQENKTKILNRIREKQGLPSRPPNYVPRAYQFWSSSELERIKWEYPIRGGVALSREMGRPVGQIYKAANTRNTCVTRKPMTPHEYRTRFRWKLMREWAPIRAPQAESEHIGKTWLRSNGFEYVYWFAEHPGMSGKPRKQFPFDYYAELKGQRWFIDATIAASKGLDVRVIRVFSRFARIGVLFVGKEASYLKEVSPKTRTHISYSILDAIKHKRPLQINQNANKQVNIFV